MSEQSLNVNHEDENSLKEIIDFFVKSWVPMLGFFTLGIVFAYAYILIVPSRYEAIMHLQMAQISLDENNILLQRVNVEEPNLLIARLKVPNSYPEHVINACGSSEKIGQQDPVKILNYSLVKGASSIVQVKVQMNEKNLAVDCLNELFKSIEDSQFQTLKTHIEEAKFLRNEHQRSLKNSLNIIAKADESGMALSAGYLSALENIRYLNKEIARLGNFIKSSYSLRTKLIAPIFVSDNPVFPNKKFIIIIGGVIGLCLGFIFSLFNNLLSKFNSNLTGAKHHLSI